MDQARFSDIAHSRLPFYGPLDPVKVDALIDLLDLSQEARVFDAGCGKGELLARIVERYGATGFGVDTSPYAIRRAQTMVAVRMPEAPIRFQQADISDIQIQPDSLDLAICVGSTHLYGGLRQAIAALWPSVRPGGHILVGDLYWRQEPHPDLLAMFGIEREAYSDYAGTVLMTLEEGLNPIYSFVSSEEDWDRYEWLYRYSIHRHVQENPDDPDIAQMIEREGLGFQMYMLGREVNGFIVMLLQVGP